MNEHMKSKILAYNAQVPRYTSYPTAPHFKPLAAADYAAWLSRLEGDAHDLSIYIHIPFCAEMCWYCGCHTTATRKYAPIEDYVTLLLREMDIAAAFMPARGTVRHIHFGGGSPSMLYAPDFTRIMQKLRVLFDIAPDAEIALEADPRGITRDRAEAYAAAGVNRASFGVQDFSPAVQAAINRVQSYDTVARAAETLRGAGVAQLNFDLMYGLPLQTAADARASAEKALSLAPARVALFGYAHVPWMKKHMRLIREAELPDASARLDQFAAAEEALRAGGMQAVGLDHFCAAGDEMLRARGTRGLMRNFQGYTTDTARTLLGFGLSSIGRLPQGFAQNHANLTEYRAAVLRGELPAARGCAADGEDRLRAEIISDLMCYLEADVGAILRRHGRDAALFDGILSGFADMEADGLASRTGRLLRVHPAARQMVRVAAARFDAYFTGEKNRHVQAA